MTKKLIFHVDMDDTLCEYTPAYREALRINPSIKFPQSQLDFFRNLKPKENGIDVLKAFQRDCGDVLDFYILTAPSVENPLCYMEKRIWVEQHLGKDFVNRLIISPNKGLIKGDYLIDDNLSGKGQQNFEGKLIHFGSPRYLNWSIVGEEIANILNVKYCGVFKA